MTPYAVRVHSIYYYRLREVNTAVRNQRVVFSSRSRQSFPAHYLRHSASQYRQPAVVETALPEELSCHVDN